MKLNHIFKVPTSLEIEYLQLKFKPSNNEITQNENIRCSLSITDILGYYINRVQCIIMEPLEPMVPLGPDL